MKKLRFSKLFFLLLALGLFIGTSPASAALYQDTFTALVTSAANYNGGWNPYNLPTTRPNPFVPYWTFSWSIVYDEASINEAGTIRFNGFNGTIFVGDPPIPRNINNLNNQISIAIPRPGSPQIFTQMDDDLYDPTDWMSNPDGFFDISTKNFLGLGYAFNQQLLPSPYTGAISISFYQNEIWFEDGISKATVFGFYPNYETFDRQVVPIPGALVLLGSGLAALTILKRRKG